MKALIQASKAALICAIFTIILSINFASSAEYCNDYFLLKFIDSANIIRTLDANGVMLVGIDSVDSLSVKHSVIHYHKMAKDFPDSSRYSKYFLIFFQDPKPDIEEVRYEFDNDSHIEYTELFEDTLVLQWEPNDMFYDLDTPILYYTWPEHCEWGHNPIPDFCGPYDIWWGRVFAEQWHLYNDGNPYFEDPDEHCWLVNFHSSTYREDINAVEAWQFYLDSTQSDPNGIPGDTSVILGHIDDGIDIRTPDIKDALWFNPKEDHGTLPNSFDPDIWWEDGGDKGSPTLWDGVPGQVGDDDNDGYADWNDWGIRELIGNYRDDDGDKGQIIEWPPGHSYIRDGKEDEPHIIHPPDKPYICDCPHTLVDVVDPSDPFGRRFSESDLGIEEYDDDEDGFVDECDGAMWDDDENGYVDDVIGWDFLKNPRYIQYGYGIYCNNPTPSHGGHGSKTIGIAVANAYNEEDEVPPGDLVIECAARYSDIDFSRMRKGVSGICPDARFVELKWGDLESIFYGLDMKLNVFSQAAFIDATDLMGEVALESDAILFRGDHSQPPCPAYYPDDFDIVHVGGTKPSGGYGTCENTRIDVSAPAYVMTSTRGITSDDEYVKWTDHSIKTTNNGGTSSAVQLVSGAAALLYSFSKLNGLNWTNTEIMARLINNSKKYEPGYYENYSRTYHGPDWHPMGVGRLDVYGAISGDVDWGDPNIIFEFVFIDYDIGPGNQDQVMSQGEEFGIYFKVFYYGPHIENTEWTLFCDDPNVEILNPTQLMGDIAPWSYFSTKPFPFIVRISEDAPPGQTISFRIEIAAPGMNPLVYLDVASGLVSMAELYSVCDFDEPNNYYPVLCELDEDIYPEIVINDRHRVKAVNAEDGSRLWISAYFEDLTPWHSPSVGDLNGDGINEVVLVSGEYPGSGYIAVLDNNGQLIAGPEDLGGPPYEEPPVLADWDNDGNLDIIFGQGLYVKIFKLVGTNLDLISSFQVNGPVEGISAADLNNDGKIDLVVGSFSDLPIEIYYNLESTPEYSFSDALGTEGPPSIGDFDNDSQLEILFLDYNYGTQSAWVLDLVGGEWRPINIYSVSETAFGNQQTSVGDLNDDELLELIFYDAAHSEIYIYDYQGGSGQLYSNDWPTEFFKDHDGGDILIADLNTDGFKDLLFSGDWDDRRIIGLSSFGTSIWSGGGLAIIIGNEIIQNTVPAIGDFDNNHIIDIFSNSFYETDDPDEDSWGWLEGYTTGGQIYDGALQWPQYRHDARRTGLYAQPISTLFVTQDMTIWDNLVVWDGIYIQNGATLTIKPGVSIKMKPGSSISVLGTLIAEGNPSEPISITGTDPSPGSWPGIFVGNSSNIRLENCILKHGQYGIRGVEAENTVIEIDSTIISNISNIGISVEGADLTVTNSEISSCGTMGIYTFSGVIYAENNSILNTYLYGIRVEDSPGIIGGTSEIIGNEIGLDNEPPSGSMGIYCDGCELLRCYGNNIYSFDQAGIKLSNGIYEVEENIIHNIDFSGLTFSNFAQSEVVFRNQISSAEICVWCEGQSYPILGLDEENLWGYNSFTNFIKYGVHNYNPDPEEILAQRNWWGEPRCPEFDSPVLCKPPLEDNPFAKAVVEDPSLPREFMLHQNYPNPFNSNTIIRFDLPRRSDVTIRIYNILGQLVNTLVDRNANPGYHSIIWDGKNASGKSVASGIYLYNIVAGDYRSSKKMTIIK